MGAGIFFVLHKFQVKKMIKCKKTRKYKIDN